MMPSPWPDQLSGGLAASRPDISRRPRWPKEGRTRGYITRASIPKEVVARRESDRVRGRGRGRGRAEGGHGELEMLFGVRLPKPSEIGANPARRRSIMGEEAPSCESRLPLELVGRYRPVATVSASAHVFGSDGGSTCAADDAAGRQIRWADAWYPQAQAGLGHGPSQNGTTTRDHGALCAGLNRRIGHVSTSPVSRHTKAQELEPKRPNGAESLGRLEVR